MVNSMTGFASVKGRTGDMSWGWELRSVNARGLDIRVRTPERVEGLEPMIRAEIARRVSRGSLTLTLRLQREGGDGAERLDRAQLDTVLAALAEVEAAAGRAGLALRAASPAEILALRGVMGAASEDPAEDAVLVAALRPSLSELLDSFAEMRAAEGRELARLLAQRLEDLRRLVTAARETAELRSAEMAQNFSAALARILDNAEGADPDRVAQELAVLAVKADVSEELDRLDAHVTAAEKLLAAEGAVGRKLDFLMQEFNREANTLCSKSGHSALTAVGLDLKAVIDQMREQVQNVE